MNNDTTCPVISTSVITVDRRYNTEVEKAESSKLQVTKWEVSPEELSSVMAELGVTINTGNYESLRVSCSVKLPSYKEELSAATEEAFRICEEVISEKVAGFNSRLASMFTKK